MDRAARHSYGIVGGLSALAGADLFLKLMKASPGRNGTHQDDVFLEQHAFPEATQAGAAGSSQTGRKLYIFDMIRSFQQRGADCALLPCFISHTFLGELTAELALPVVNLMEALRDHVERRHPAVRRLGILTSDYVIQDGLFGRTFDASRYTLIYPRPEIQAECLMPAIYGPGGIKSGCLNGASIPLLRRACDDLAAQGAELILPGFTEIPIVLESLAGGPVSIVDCNQVYAQYALDHGQGSTARVCKIGIVGGVGPAATVDFIHKILQSTPAQRDQEHLKLVVEQNPQIPDRTANLVGGGIDPTIALYATCKKLEAAGADLIAIPCNTAHAFVERIQPYLGIPVINMLFETVQHLQQRLLGHATVGLLATDGTVKSRIYHEALERAGIRLVVPEEPYQRRVMDAIYGPCGVKAGHSEGRCREDLLSALEHLVRDKSAEVIILGCTELPLLLPASQGVSVAGQDIPVLDPTMILAMACVRLAQYGTA